MKQYIFYTSEGLTQSPMGETLENIQLLGFSSGKNVQDAKRRLVCENRWILSNGFNERKIESRQLFDEQSKHLIEQLISYVLENKNKRYEERTDNDHIFLILKELKNLID